VRLSVSCISLDLLKTACFGVDWCPMMLYCGLFFLVIDVLTYFYSYLLPGCSFPDVIIWFLIVDFTVFFGFLFLWLCCFVV
jgi:hypothetical protein